MLELAYAVVEFGGGRQNFDDQAGIEQRIARFIQELRLAADGGDIGTQRFESGAALAGNPVRLVSGGILTRWGLLGYEAGAAGVPVSDPTVFSTFGANSGVAQEFAGGAIYNATAGPRSSQAYFVTGLILLRYNTFGGPGGDYGMPTSDEFVTAGVHQQNFEGGNMTWSAGDSAAKEHAAAKTPGLIVSPATLQPRALRYRGFPQ